MDILAERLKACRKALGLTQRELAEQAGMDQGHISRLENDGKGASTEKLQALARVLGVTVSHLIGDEIRETPPEYHLAPGLRELIEDHDLARALNIQEHEWQLLRALSLPAGINRHGYVQLLITLRAITPPRTPGR